MPAGSIGLGNRALVDHYRGRLAAAARRYTPATELPGRTGAGRGARE